MLSSFAANNTNDNTLFPIHREKKDRNKKKIIMIMVTINIAVPLMTIEKTD